VTIKVTNCNYYIKLPNKFYINFSTQISATTIPVTTMTEMDLAMVAPVTPLEALVPLEPEVTVIPFMVFQLQEPPVWH